MPLQRPTLTELRDRAAADVAASLGRGPLLIRSIPYLLAQAVAGVAHSLYGYLEFVARQPFPDTAEAENLDRLAALYGITRREAEFARGTVTFSGTVGSLLRAGSQLRREDGVLFEILEGVTFAAATATVEVRAVTAGALANSAGGTILTLVAPIAGIVSAGTVDAGGVSGGADRESDDDLRARTLERLRDPGQGGNAADYARWAKTVPGVTRAWAIPVMNGLGTVGVAIMRDGDADPFPDATAIAQVQTVIDELRPVGLVGVEVFAPTAVPVDFALSIDPDTPALRARVEAALEDFLFREGAPRPRVEQTVVPLSRIAEAISSVDGIRSHIVTAPAAAPVVRPREILRVGTFTWS